MIPEAMILAAMNDADFHKFLKWSGDLKCTTLQEAIVVWWLIRQQNFN